MRITTDQTELDIDLLYDFLHNQARWCLGIPRDTLTKAIANSLCFGAFIGDQQIGFCRMVTDYATFGNLVDVFVLPEYRGQGVCRKLLSAVNEHPELQNLRRIMLATSDKHDLYKKLGFKPTEKPELFMEKFNPLVYS